MKKSLIFLFVILIAVFYLSCTIKPVTLTVNIDPIDSGNVIVEVGSETLDSADYYEIESGKEVTLTADPDNGYEFVEWEDGSIESTRTITIESDTTVTANFQETMSNEFDLIVTFSNATITANGNELTSDIPLTFTEGTDVKLIVTPDTGYQFTEWTGDLTGTDNPATITMDTDKDITANFSVITTTYDLTVTFSNVSVSADGNNLTSGNPETFAENTNVELIVTPDTGYQFDGWAGDLTGTDNPATITMDADKNITAVIESIITTYDLTVTFSNGSVSADGNNLTSGNPETFAENTNVELIVTPDTGYQFDGWAGTDASDVTGTGPYYITMDTDKDITANFSVITTGFYESFENTDGTGSPFDNENVWGDVLIHTGGLGTGDGLNEVPPIISTEQAVSPTQSLKLTIDNGDGTVTSNDDESLVTLDLTTGTGGATISFKYYLSLGSTDYSEFYFVANDTQVIFVENTGSNGSWLDGTYTLDPDTTYELGWYIDCSTGATEGEAQAAYIDDVDITGDFTMTTIGPNIEIENNGINISGSTFTQETASGVAFDMVFDLSNIGKVAQDLDDTNPIVISDMTGLTLDTTSLTDPIASGDSTQFTISHDGSTSISGVTVDIMSADATVAETFTLVVNIATPVFEETFEDTDGAGSGFDNENVWNELALQEIYDISEVSPIISTEQAVSPTHSLKLQCDVNTHSYDYDESLKVLDVQTGPNGATVIFSVYLTLWSSNYSHFYFKANGNDEVHYFNTTNNGTWMTEIIMLNPNTTYELEWFLDAYGTGDNTQAAYIDDVKLLGDVSVIPVDSDISLEYSGIDITDSTLDTSTPTNSPANITIDITNSGKLTQDLDDTNPVVISDMTNLSLDTSTLTEPINPGDTTSFTITHDGTADISGVTIDIVAADTSVVTSFTLSVSTVTPIFSEDFTATDADSSGTYEWTELDSNHIWTINNGSYIVWGIVDDYNGSSLNGTQFAFADGQSSSPIYPGDTLEMITPDIDTTGKTNLSIRFSLFYDENYSDDASIEVWNGTQWINVYDLPESDVGDWSNPASITIDVSSYIDITDFKVKFLYDGVDSDKWWAIDDVVVY